MEKKEVKYLYLKFGGIKGGDYGDSPEANELSNKLNELEVESKEYKELAIDIINSFNGKIWEWWYNKVISKKKAIEYITTYRHILST